MTEHSKPLSDQEIEDLLGLLDTPVFVTKMSAEIRDVAEWFLPALGASADLAEASNPTPFVPSKQRMVSATIRRHGVKFAPLCFGSPYFYEPTEPNCRECRFRDRCAARAIHQAPCLVLGSLLPAPHPDHLMARSHDTPAMAAMRRHIREFYTRQSGNSRKRILAADRAYRQKSRTKPDIASIEREFRARLTGLKRAVAASRRDKSLQQLRGRETRIARAWKARQFARLNHGAAASDENVACAYRRLIRGTSSYSRHQARTDCRWIEKLENINHVWGAFKKTAV